MRKIFFVLTFVLCMLLCLSASAATYTFEDIYATCELSDDYIVLTPDNLAYHPEWLANKGTTEEAMLVDYEARGVLLQAWNLAGDVCVEITAVQDDMAKSLFDVDQQTSDTRKSYRIGHSNGTIDPDLGYDITNAEWSNTKTRGRFLMMKYNYEANNQKGYLRRTIRNGFTISVDYQVFGRKTNANDSKAIDKIMKSFAFTQTLPKPADAVPNLFFESTPPSETSTGKFSVDGTGEPGLKIIAVLMRMSSPDPMTIEETVNKSGKFSIDVKLPKEGVWLMTLTVLNGDTVTEEVFFETTTYQTGLLSIDLDQEIPTELTEDTLTISGKTVKQTSVQCIVDGPATFTKQVRTNNSGKFSFKIPTDKEGEYVITLVFEKKNYDPRRIQTVATRTLTEADIRADIREQGDKTHPAYTTLNDKLKGYTGRVMGYNLYVKSVEQSGNEWITFMAMRKTKSGAYRDIVAVMSVEKPEFTEGSKVRIYATCTGGYEVQGEDKTTTYPAFDLLFWEQAD